jgi:hypothetical protein
LWRLKIFESRDDVSNEDVLFLFRAVSENIGIETLDLSNVEISDESWDVMCQSLANHPAIEFLVLYETTSHDVAVKKTQGALRAPLFGRALHSINDNDTFLFMMVKGNVDLFAGLARVRTRRARKRTRYSK